MFSNVKGTINWGALVLPLEVINLGCPTSAPSGTGVLIELSLFVEVGRSRGLISEGVRI